LDVDLLVLDLAAMLLFDPLLLLYEFVFHALRAHPSPVSILPDIFIKRLAMGAGKSAGSKLMDAS